MKLHVTEVLFRRVVLIILPLVIILPLTTALALRPAVAHWQTTASVWVDPYKPLYMEDRLGYTPALNQADLMNNFVRTRAFALSVLQKTSLAPQLADPRTADRLVKEFPRHVYAAASSNAFINVVVTTVDRDLSLQTIRAALDLFQQTLVIQLETQGKAALSLTSTNLTQAQTALGRSQQNLATYLAEHPDTATRTGGSDFSARDRDPQLAQLFDQLNTNQAAFAAAQQRYNDAVQATTAGKQGQPFTFAVVDQPQLPLNPLLPSRLSKLKLPVVGAVLGLFISVVVAVVLVMTNHRVFGAYDVARVLDVPVLAQIPPLRGYRWKWQRKPSVRRWFSWRWQSKPADEVRLRLTVPARTMAPKRGSV